MDEVNSHALSSKVLHELLQIVPSGGTILEIGTGAGTQVLTPYFEVFSVEDDPQWHTGHSTLLEVPLVDVASFELPRSFTKRFPRVTRWYDPQILAAMLEGLYYDAIIIDGPAGVRTRAAMWWFYDKLFDTQVPVIVDDVHRHPEWMVAAQIARYKGLEEFRVVFGKGGNNILAVIE